MLICLAARSEHDPVDFTQGDCSRMLIGQRLIGPVRPASAHEKRAHCVGVRSLSLGEQFDTVLDSGLFHVFDDDDRARYVESLRAATAPGGSFHMLCFSDRQPGDWGPRRVTRAEIEQSFTDGWRIETIEPVVFETNLDPGEVLAWRSEISRVT